MEPLADMIIDTVHTIECTSEGDLFIVSKHDPSIILRLTPDNYHQLRRAVHRLAGLMAEIEALGEDLIRQKQAGKPIELPERREPAQLVEFMEALRRSLEVEKRTPVKVAAV